MPSRGSDVGREMALGRPFCGHCCASRRVWPRAGRGVRVCLCVCVCECVRVCVNEAHHRARRFGRLRVFASVVSSPSTAPSSASAEFRHFLPQRSRSQPPPPTTTTTTDEDDAAVLLTGAAPVPPVPAGRFFRFLNQSQIARPDLDVSGSSTAPLAAVWLPNEPPWWAQPPRQMRG